MTLEDKAAVPAVETAERKIVDEWFAAHFHNAPMAHNTDCYNQLVSAKEDLKKRLSAPRK